MSDTIISPLAIDLGGRYTGLFMAHYAHGEDPAHADREAGVLCLPAEGDSMVWSQQNRTSRRHMVRNAKRRKLARRLLRLLVEQALGMEPDLAQWSRLSGYLKRRGYNRLQVEQDVQLLEECPPDWFAERLPAVFDSVQPLAVQLDNLLQSSESIHALLEDDLFRVASKKDFKRKLPAGMDSWEKNLLTRAWGEMRKILQEAQREREGNRHRSEYLDNIAHDLARDALLAPMLSAAAIEPERLARLIGHVSNLQLRPLRWYFNDPDMAGGDRWDAARLHGVMRRWMLGLRPDDSEQKAARRRVLGSLDDMDDVVGFLLDHDPRDTIPPYEDQNNRRPPRDKTLWLSPAALERRFPHWQRWVSALRRSNPELAEGLEPVVRLTDRRSRPAARERRASLFLQRLLDRSRPLDPYALRLLATGSDSETAQNARATLGRDLGSQHLQGFLEFATAYYDEIRLARQGLWQASEEGLLECADLNPPHKSRILHLLVGNLLGEPAEQWSPERLEAFRREAWDKPFKGRSTPRSVGTRWVEVQKNWGNLLGEQLRRLAWRHDRLGQQPREWRKKEQELWKQREAALQATDHLARWLGHDERQKAHYANPWTLIQLYNLLEKDLHGFSRTTLAAHLENAWRMSKVTTEDGSEAARCSRLSSDTVRPFDGVLRRLLERQAATIARAKLEQIRERKPGGQSLLIPILIEENRFTFTLGIKELKKRRDKKLQKILDERREQQDQLWQEKMQRIHSASGNLCPYTGEPIGEDGEYDHIVPRAASRDRAGTVYNSEANLIWCSRKGNRQKGDRRYSLHHLAPAYLQQQFGSRDPDAVGTGIRSRVMALPDGFLFQELATEQQQAVRHALFLEPVDPAYQKVMRSLAEQQKARVNGTQAWLARHIMELLGRELKAMGIEHRFLVQRVDAKQVHGVRQRLGEALPHLLKTENQPVASHAVDALCVLAAAAADTDTAERLALPETLLEDIPWLAGFLPGVVRLLTIRRRPAYRKRNVSATRLFNEGIYAERFLPVWVRDGTLHFGFDLEDNVLTLDSRHAHHWLMRLLPVLRHPDGHKLREDADTLLGKGGSQRYIIDRDTAFNHLHKVAKEPADSAGRELADLLDGLSYFVQKQKLRNAFAGTNDKCKSRPDVLKEKDFTVKIECGLGSRNRLGQVKGMLCLPVMADWQRFLDHLDEKGHFHPGEPLPDADTWQALCAHWFRDTGNRDHWRRHKGTRRKYSLPRVVAPAGKLFRVRRTRCDGSTLWQLQAANGSPSCGFAIRDGKVQWGEPVLLPALAQSADLVPRGGRYRPPAEAVAWFDEWRDLPRPAPLEALAMAPGTKTRVYLRLRLPWDALRAWAGLQQQDPLELPVKIKINAAGFVRAHGIGLLGKPRDGKIEFRELGRTVEIQYEAEGVQKEMKAAWEAAGG